MQLQVEREQQDGTEVDLEIRFAVAVDIALQQMVGETKLAGGVVKGLNVDEVKCCSPPARLLASNPDSR